MVPAAGAAPSPAPSYQRRPGRQQANLNGRDRPPTSEERTHGHSPTQRPAGPPRRAWSHPEREVFAIDELFFARRVNPQPLQPFVPGCPACGLALVAGDFAGPGGCPVTHGFHTQAAYRTARAAFAAAGGDATLVPVPGAPQTD